jgi:hypothetical protein
LESHAAAPGKLGAVLSGSSLVIERLKAVQFAELISQDEQISAADSNGVQDQIVTAQILDLDSARIHFAEDGREVAEVNF